MIEFAIVMMIKRTQDSKFNKLSTSTKTEKRVFCEGRSIEQQLYQTNQNLENKKISVSNGNRYSNTDKVDFLASLVFFFSYLKEL